MLQQLTVNKAIPMELKLLPGPTKFVLTSNLLHILPTVRMSMKRFLDPEKISMKFTFQFINETVRLANIVPGIFRKALRDIQYKGYTIPAGWTLMVCPPAVHLNPAKYPDPLNFNPWRWEGKELNGASKHFMAFGGGIRFCVGAEFTKLQMAVFLHCLVTKYRWKVIKGGDILRTPGLQFPNGFHVQIIEKEPCKRGEFIKPEITISRIVENVGDGETIIMVSPQTHSSMDYF